MSISRSLNNMKIRYMIVVILLTSLMLDYVCGPFHVADTVAEMGHHSCRTTRARL